MFCGPTLSLLDVQNNLTTFAWLPLVIWCAASRASARWSAAAIAMSFLAGEPFFAAAGALIFAIVRRRRGVLDVAAQSFALAGVQLLPFLAMVWGSDRARLVDLRSARLHAAARLAARGRAAVAHEQRLRPWVGAALHPHRLRRRDDMLARRGRPHLRVAPRRRVARPSWRGDADCGRPGGRPAHAPAAHTLPLSGASRAARRAGHRGDRGGRLGRARQILRPARGEKVARSAG